MNNIGNYMATISQNEIKYGDLSIIIPTKYKVLADDFAIIFFNNSKGRIPLSIEGGYWNIDEYFIKMDIDSSEISVYTIECKNGLGNIYIRWEIGNYSISNKLHFYRFLLFYNQSLKNESIKDLIKWKFYKKNQFINKLKKLSLIELEEELDKLL